MRFWFRRTPVSEELQQLREENARLRYALATAQISQWMWRAQTDRGRLATEPTAVTPASALRRSR